LKTLSQQERTALSHERGVCLSVGIEHAPTRKEFFSKCGANARNPAFGDSIQPSREQGGTNIQHVTLLSKQGTHEQAAFFISRDKGKAYYYGQSLPDRLFRRMKRMDGTTKQHRHATDLIYLATGPHDCYYAQFRSGECWWGSLADQDAEFSTICTNWNVARVAFGPCTLIQNNHVRHLTTSWVILSRDGRAAWKNIPSRLAHLLMNRLASDAAPVEVALGNYGAYYCRFLDGTSDYCLPDSTSKIVQSLQRRGATITSISLHPELNDFIIRHTSTTVT
jgi:hypothetical protein